MNLACRLARWSLQLQELYLEIIHRSGQLHTDADVLSRNPVRSTEPETEIPMFSFDYNLSDSNQKLLVAHERSD